ncbi:hypothetical protein B0H13DRAFT_2314619 [Mycena leptocephala]|nr:hypothetical protein B0H13DRAFT_2314619 [Mycena leptocephala]
MDSEPQDTSLPENTRSQDAQHPCSASLLPDSHPSTAISQKNTLLPEAELRKPFWTDFPWESFYLPRGAPTLTANLEELVPFVMTDEEIFSFRYLDHPAITSLVPYVRRGNHFRAANPAYLAQLNDQSLA